MAQYLGKVIGTKMDKTAKVMVTSLKLHPKILKVNDFLLSMIFSNLLSNQKIISDRGSCVYDLRFVRSC